MFKVRLAPEPCKKCLYWLECDDEKLKERIYDWFRDGYDCFCKKWSEDDE